MAGARILVVDDEPKIVEVVKSYLENAGYEVRIAYSGQQALELFEETRPSLVILDLMLPDIAGEEVCEVIRKKSRVPIIMLTARIDEESVLRGLNTGADDYVTKPFSPRQLMARVAAVLRRAGHEGGASVVSFNDNDLIVDTENRSVMKAGSEVGLTPKEFKLLVTLMGHPRKVFTRDELITLVMGYDYEGYDRIIDTHIKNIRQKIETDPKNPAYILTIHGVGYRFGGVRQ